MFCEIFCKEFCGINVTHVSGTTGYALFQVLGISTHTQHFIIVIGFQYQIVGFADIMCCGRSYFSEVGKKREYLSVYLDAISHIVRTVMRNFKRFDTEIFLSWKPPAAKPMS